MLNVHPATLPNKALAEKARLFSRRLYAAERSVTHRGHNRPAELRRWLDARRRSGSGDALAMFIADFRFAMDLEARRAGK